VRDCRIENARIRELRLKSIELRNTIQVGRKGDEIASRDEGQGKSLRGKLVRNWYLQEGDSSGLYVGLGNLEFGIKGWVEGDQWGVVI